MTQPHLTLDSHIDIPWPHGANPFATTDRRVDLPKMRAGGMAAGCFVAYVPQTACDDLGRQAAADRALAMLGEIGAMGRAENGITACVTSRAADIEAAFGRGEIAVIPAVENGHALGGVLGRVGAFARLGARYVTLTHNGHNDLADSAIPRRDLNDPEQRHGGLSPFGREIVTEMNRQGLLVDVSHAAKTTMLQAASLSQSPVVATHSCVRALCDHPRNLDDEQLDRLAETGGVIQITAMPHFLRPRGQISGVGVSDMIDHVDYAVRRIGIDHVGLSSDFDGGGAVTGWMNASETGNVTAELTRRGYGSEAVAALWGGNFLRLLRVAEAIAAG